MATLLHLAVPSFADWCAVYVLDGHGPEALAKSAHSVTDTASGAVRVNVRSRRVADQRQGVLDILRTGCAELFPRLSDAMLDALVEQPAQRAALRGAGARSGMVVPLTGNTGVVGAACFIVTSVTPAMGGYTRGDFETVRKLGQMVGLAIDNGRRFAAAQHRPHSRLHSVVSALRLRASSVVDPELLVSEAVNGVCAALDVDACAFLEYSAGDQTLRLKSGAGWPTGLVGRVAIGAFPDSFSGFALMSSDPVEVFDSRTETRFTVSSLLRDHGMASGAAVSIRDRGVPVGVLGAYSRRRRHFSIAEQSFLEEVAEIVGGEIGRGAVENEVRSLKGELHSILSGIGDGVLVQDIQGFLVYANASAARTLEDASMDSLLATPARDLFTRFRPASQAGDDPILPPWERAMQGEPAPSVLMTYQRSASSEERSLLAGSSPVLDDAGQVQRVITIIRDLRESARMESGPLIAVGGASPVEAPLTGLAEILETERRRVAYDIHDGLAQIATSAYQHLEAFADRHRAVCPEEHAELEEMRDLTRRTVREARRVIAELRPTVLDDFGLVVAVREEVEELRKSGWLVLFDDELAGQRLPRHVEVALFRVAQEALANARKHAGMTPIWVTLERRGTTVRLEVRDSGQGFDAGAPARQCMAGERVGLVGMRERMALLGGACVIASQPGEGTRVIAAISVEPAGA